MKNPFIKSLALLIVFIGLVAYFLFDIYPKGNHFTKQKVELYNHSSTMDIKIVEKFNEWKTKKHYRVRVKNQFEPYQEYSIVTKDKNFWNLIILNETYFVNVSWNSSNFVSDITNQETTLMQIEPIKID